MVEKWCVDNLGEILNSYVPCVEQQDHRSYELIPYPFRKQIEFKYGLFERDTICENTLKVIFFVLALRHMKNYEITIKTVLEPSLCHEYCAYGPNNALQLIYLNHKLFAMSSGSTFFYSNEELLLQHDDSLSYLLAHLHDEDMMKHLNVAEKVLLKAWLLNVREINQYDWDDSFTFFVNRFITELGFESEFAQYPIHFGLFGEQLDVSIGCAGMDNTCIAYPFEMNHSDLIVTVGDDKQTNYLFFDVQALKTLTDLNTITIMNHLRYIDYENHINDKNQSIIWIFSHVFKIKLSNNTAINSSLAEFFADNIFRIGEKESRAYDLSSQSLHYNGQDYVYPYKAKILKFFSMSHLQQCTQLYLDKDYYILVLYWTINKLQFQVSKKYRGTTQVIDLGKKGLNIKNWPNHYIEGWHQYETRYDGNLGNFSIKPQKAIENKDNMFYSEVFPAMHILYNYRQIENGFLFLNDSSGSNSLHEEEVTVELKLYPKKIICKFRYKDYIEPGYYEIEANQVLSKYCSPFLYYKSIQFKSEVHVLDDSTEHLFEDVQGNIEEIMLSIMNHPLKNIFMSEYSWLFDDSRQYYATKNTLSYYIKQFFYVLSLKGYKRNNINWEIDFSNLRLKSAEIFLKHNLDQIMASRYFNSGEYEQQRYLDTHVHYVSKQSQLKSLLKLTKILKMVHVYVTDDYCSLDRWCVNHHELELLKDQEVIIDGCEQIFDILSNPNEGYLELIGAEQLSKVLKLLKYEPLKNFVYRKLEDLQINELDPATYESQINLILIMMTYLYKCINQLLLSLNSEDSHTSLVVQVDEDSSLIKILRKANCFGIFAEIIDAISRGHYKFEKLLFNQSEVEPSKDIQLYSGSNETYIQHMSKAYGLVENDEILLILKQMLLRKNTHDMLSMIKSQSVNSTQYINHRLSMIKGTYLKQYKNVLDYDEEMGIGYSKVNLFANKQLLFLNNRLDELDKSMQLSQSDIKKHFYIIKSQSSGIEKFKYKLLLPALISKKDTKNISEGIVYAMDSKHFIRKPDIHKEDFELINKEHAQVAYEIISNFSDYLEHEYAQGNGVLNDEINKKLNEIEQLKVSLKYMDDLNFNKENVIGKLVDEKNQGEKIIEEYIGELSTSKEKIAQLQECTYSQVIMKEFNDFLNDSSSLQFFRKYKKIPAKIVEEVTIKKALKGEVFLFQLDEETFLVLPNKRKFTESLYIEIIKSIYDVGISGQNHKDLAKLQIKSFAICKKSTNGNSYDIVSKGELVTCNPIN